MFVPTGQQRSPWSRSLPCDTLAPTPLGFIIVILFIFSIKNKKSHIQQRVLCGSLSIDVSKLLQPSSHYMGHGSALEIHFFYGALGAASTLPMLYPIPKSPYSFLFPCGQCSRECFRSCLRREQ